MGCTQAQPAVNQVQPNVVDKAVFEDGEWYFLQTVIDTPYSAPYTFVGEQGNTEKVEFEVQEEYLIVRRSYQHIANSEPDGLAGETLDGAAIAMYRIESHFDIRRGYNPLTGEENNVIMENTTDRPWYDRQYMRVDWSENLITNNDFLVGAKLFDGIETEPVSYFVEPGLGHPHEPQFVRNEETDQIDYIDIVNKMFVRPTTAKLDFGDGEILEIPTCFLVTQGHYDCAPGEVTVRNSFMRVDEARDYEPMVYTGDRMERFGYFVTERAGYTNDYGAVESDRFRFVNRHNLWQESHKKDANGELITCTAATADVCGGNGSVCDTDWGVAYREKADDGTWLGACTIPYREREVRPIAYHLSANFPEDLIPDVYDMAQGWNEAFVGVVASLRENECLANGGDDASCAAERTREDHQNMYVICSNPVVDTDNAACGEPGTSAQIGDLRYSLIGWVNEPHASSPLGYGPSSADPETGEIIMGNAFMYGAGVETLQAFARDIVALLNDDYTETDVSSGEVVRAWVERNSEPGSIETGRPADDHVAGVDGFDEHLGQGMDFSWAEAFGSADGDSRIPTSVGEFVQRMQEAERTLRRNGAFGNGEEMGSARLANLRGTDIERLLTGSEVRLAAGVDPSFDASFEGVLDSASPLRGMNLRKIEALNHMQAQMATEGHCMLHADFADDGLLGLARAVQRAVNEGDGTMEWYGRSYQVRQDDGSIDYDAVSDMLRHPMFHGVTGHEVGHTIGLRHNFSGSFDALNYSPRYWELRDDGSMAPRAYDPMTQAEFDGRIREYEYSTVMDYGNNFVVTDAHGVGHYDHAAVKMGYGDLVEVFANATNPEDVNWWNFIQRAGWPIPLKLEAFTGSGVSAYQYTDWPEVVGSTAQMQERVDVPYTSLVPDSFLASQGIRDALSDEQGRPSVPYMFCSDEQRDLGPDCYLYDAGADPYETVNSVIDNYWNYYIFNAFRRGRLGFHTSTYASRIHGRYFNKLKYSNQIYALYRTLFEEIFGDAADFDTFWTRPDGMGAYTGAVESAFKLFTRVITTPEPGGYSRGTRGDGSEALLASDARFPTANVSSFDGRALETTWDFDAGYFWFDQLDRAGYYYDKVLALMVMTDPQTNFLGRDTAADVRRYQINFYSSYPEATTNFLGGLLASDWSTISPRQVDGELVYPDPVELAEGNMAGTPVDPNASFSIQLYGATYGMAQIPETFDRTFFQKSRIWVLEGAETVGVTGPTVQFTDPGTGLTYVAASFPEDGVEMGPAAKMILHAQALSDNGANAELSQYMDNLNVIRRLSWLFDFGS
ncbi:MAG: hypothetical protein CMN30_05580 [Sandaracinus sp.]|nr:hypothetical protein [Sandaracinus sp.]